MRTDGWIQLIGLLSLMVALTGAIPLFIPGAFFGWVLGGFISEGITGDKR